MTTDPRTPEEAIIRHIEKRRKDAKFEARRARIGPPCPHRMMHLITPIRCQKVEGHEGCHEFHVMWGGNDEVEKRNDG